MALQLYKYMFNFFRLFVWYIPKFVHAEKEDNSFSLITTSIS